MSGWEQLRFRGRFRDYQQRVLDHAEEYLQDGRINIVAAPGSGKTILGLELLRRLGKPCLILSPTTAIRRQWGQRLEEMFLGDDMELEDVFSSRPGDFRLINSITYQALYHAVEREAGEDDAEEDVGEEPESDEAPADSTGSFTDYVRSQGIGAICLDEAHHLRNEWQKALESFLEELGTSVILISLTATPPYDSEASEWKRYQKVCGEVDEEIFVPELVGRKTLCPHQDYIYFNYPTEKEAEGFLAFHAAAAEAVREIGTLPFWARLAEKLNGERDYEMLFRAPGEFLSILAMEKRFGLPVDPRLIRELSGGSTLPRMTAERTERLFQFLLTDELLTEEEKDQLRGILRKNGCYEKRRVTLALNERLKREMISSVGKLESIGIIAKSEARSMGAGLRMLVLTDYIKKEEASRIGTGERFSSINVVSIFETIRRALPSGRLAVLSGSLVILPEDLVPEDCRSSELPGTSYRTVDFPKGTQESVVRVGKLFEEGAFQILIGTKSLLGEGWDSPCINSLILASFVGSFVLSNQMRGRAIRIDRNAPDKVSNIWHLVTLEPAELFADSLQEKLEARMSGADPMDSYDFEVVKRRFDTFMGPNYSGTEITSGIERVEILKPPFDRKGVERINRKMLELAADRHAVADKWLGEVDGEGFAVETETEIPADRRLPVKPFFNVALAAALAAVQSAFIYLIALTTQNPLLRSALIALILFFTAPICYFLLRTVFYHSSAARSIRSLGEAVYRTLRDMGEIADSARLDVQSDPEGMYVLLRLRNASVHDQNVFNAAITELLSPIENPRYLLIAKRWNRFYDYKRSFACPSIIGKKKENVEILRKYLSRMSRHYDAVYAYRENGRRLILKCRRKSYLTRNERAIDKRYRVSRFE